MANIILEISIFLIVVGIFLLITHKKNFFKSFYKSGIPGLIGGIILSIGYFSYVFAMYKTTVANTNFIIQTQAIFLAIFGYIFLKKKISKLTLASIILAFSGIILMVGNNLSPGQFEGNIVAFIMPISFATLILIVRKFPNTDMIPLQFFAGIGALIIGYFFSSKILISAHDIFLGFLAGAFQVGLGFILITIGARKTPAALVRNHNVNRSSIGSFMGMVICKRKSTTSCFSWWSNNYCCCFSSVF